jgi:mRNA-degrading endonuclease RelE of RelBE toxin-antitoxin system
VAYHVEFTPEAAGHLASLRAHDRPKVLDAIGRRLQHEPTRATHHRKAMRPNTLAQYRLQVGNLRVYYDVHEQPELLVLVKGIAVKIRDRVYMGGEEIEL